MKAKTSSLSMNHTYHYPWTPHYALPSNSTHLTLIIPRNTAKSLTGIREHNSRHNRWDTPNFPLPYFCW
ncbi:hypothetical protein [Desulfobotulus alkaliphilus]|uniref:hypothetical protein n=1 Tax=Desulfobotulus alkaliphilus TaxID=622671 RepID=UPI0011A357C8|nr:hypothetical protein [Desulfobotulus alkaliphilus]